MRKMMLLAAMVAIAVLMLSATPALADDRDGDGWDEDFGFWISVPVFVDVDFDGLDDNFDCDFVFCNFDDGFDDGFDDVIWVDEGTAAFDQLCSPGLPEGIWVPGCVFSDPIEEDHHFFDVPIFVLEDINFDDIDFDEDFCDCDDNWRFRDDAWRFHEDDWRFRDDR